ERVKYLLIGRGSFGNQRDDLARLIHWVGKRVQRIEVIGATARVHEPGVAIWVSRISPAACGTGGIPSSAASVTACAGGSPCRTTRGAATTASPSAPGCATTPGARTPPAPASPPPPTPATPPPRPARPPTPP